MKLGLAIGYSGSELQLPLQSILRAEELGYDSVWTGEAYGSDAITPLAYLAAKTDRIRLGTAVMQLAGRSPSMCAMQIATLGALAGPHRVIAGLGASGPQIVEGWYGQPWGRPYYRMREYVDVMRQVFTRAAPVAIEGKEFQLPYRGPGALGIGKPLTSILHTDPETPIMLGSGRETMVRLAGQVADGLLPMGFVPQTAATYLKWIEEGFQRATRATGWDSFELLPIVRVVVTNDVAGALASMKTVLALYIGGMGHRDVNFHNEMMVRQGYAEAAARIQELFLAGRKTEAAAAVPDEFCDDGALIGTPQRIAERLPAWLESGATGLLVSGDLVAIEVMGELVLGSGAAQPGY